MAVADGVVDTSVVVAGRIVHSAAESALKSIVRIDLERTDTRVAVAAFAVEQTAEASSAAASLVARSPLERLELAA